MSSTTTLVEKDVALDAETGSIPGLALIYSRWHCNLPSSFPLHKQTETLGRDASNSVSVPDQGVSRFHARLERRADGRTWVVDRRSTNGTRVNGRRVQEQALAEHDVLRIGDAVFRFVKRHVYAHSAYRIDGSVVLQARTFMHAPMQETLVGGYQIDAVLDQAARLARGNISIVIRGESGSGKELVAQAVHRLSKRAGPFVAVNCGAIPDGLVESHLFGHRRGAFTGAFADHVGLVSAAHGGTLFLDEIGDMPLAAQAKLLRVLQEREVVRVGDTQGAPVDIRVLCATHRDLDRMVEQGTFRKDLYGRLRDITLRVPPLRERREDLYALVLHFARKLGHPAPAVTNHFMAAVAQYHWPLNVRELESAVRVAVTYSEGRQLEHHHLPEPVRAALHESAVLRLAPPIVYASPTPEPVVEVADAAPKVRVRKGKPSEETLRELLKRKRGNLSAVARSCAVHRMQLYRWLESYALDPADFR